MANKKITDFSALAASGAASNDVIVLVDVSNDATMKMTLNDLADALALYFDANSITWDKIDKTSSNLADLATKSHTSLTDIGTNTHAQIDSHIADTTIHFTQSSIDHTAISNIGTNTHAQIDAHLANTSNPHNVTKAQLSLDNVTNDAQLKRANGDINSFTSKSIPEAADVILIEDSAASYVKKKVTLDDLQRAFGNHTQFFPAPKTTNYGNYAVMQLGTADTGYITFQLPDNATSIESVKLIGIVETAAAGTGKDIDLYANYGDVGDTYNTGSASDTTSTYDLSTSANKIYAFDLTTIFSGASAGDTCGLKIVHNTIGGNINYLGIKVTYKRG